MATSTFSIYLDEDVKKQLDEFCNKMGLSTNTIFSIFAHKVVLEKRIPFEIADTQPQYQQWITTQLQEREKRAVVPDTVWYTHEEFWQKVKAL